MSTNRNGVGKKSCEVEKVTKRQFSEVFGKEVSPEIFGGFPKKPKILVNPIEITKYLSNTVINKSTNIHRLIEDSCKNENAVHKGRLLDKCFVKIVNDDLTKLMAYFMKSSDRSRRLSSTDSATSSTIDPTMAVQCNICDKVYPNEKKLLNHQENKHVIEYKPPNDKAPKRVSFSELVIVHELKEYHRCRKCPKIFEEYKTLKLHMKQIHKKRKCYICYYCKKDFVDRMFFKVHIKLHCDMCGLLLENKAVFNEHRRNTCKVFKLYKCKTCNDDYFKFMDLKVHSYDHIGTYFICDICKDQFETKCGVAHHIAFLHSKRRPKSLYEVRNIGTEKLYLCKFCDLSSVDRCLIEKHVDLLPDLNNRVITGYEDYYFCDHCLKKFDTEKDMLQHKWTHFLKVDRKPEKEIKRFFKLDEKLPEDMQPKVVIEKLKHPLLSMNENNSKCNDEEVIFVDEHNGNEEVIVVDDDDSPSAKVNQYKPFVDCKSRKTILSRFQCENCNKFFSSNYCLNRHITTQHSDFENLQCKVCEEKFAWPSLLRSHKCIRLNLTEMPFEDARPEVHFDNLHGITSNGLNIDASDSYNVDFDILEPIVQFSESRDALNTVNFNGELSSNLNGEGQGGTGNSVLRETLTQPSRSVNHAESNLRDLLTQAPRSMNHSLNFINQFENPAYTSGNLNSVNRLHNGNVTLMNNMDLCMPQNPHFHTSITNVPPISSTFNPSLSPGTFIAPVNGGNYKIVVQEVPIEF